LKDRAQIVQDTHRYMRPAASAGDKNIHRIKHNKLTQTGVS